MATVRCEQQSFLDGLPGAQVREDAMLLSDFSTFPGFQPMGEVTHYGTKVFSSEGIYLPLDLWKRADAAGRFKRKRGGKVSTAGQN